MYVYEMKVMFLYSFILLCSTAIKFDFWEEIFYNRAHFAEHSLLVHRKGEIERHTMI